MDNEDPFADDTRHWQPSKDLMRPVEDGVVPELAEAVLLEPGLPIVGVDAAILMVPSDEPHPVRVSDFEGKEEENGLDLVGSPVHPIAVENVLHQLNVPGAVERSPVLEEQQQRVPQLAVDVSIHLHRGRYSEQRPLGGDDRLHCTEQRADVLGLFWDIIRPKDPGHQGPIPPAEVRLVPALIGQIFAQLLKLVQNTHRNGVGRDVVSGCLVPLHVGM
mmetsp:Transcript_10447/g.18431  ORF Transcript_10447/g.18431 Transcript_10447/m.18431 type:complete len:218 (+) Transcript_10447:1010-1663(+)